MKSWNKYSSSLADETFDAIVIGSGIGGLCSAALLALHGKRVLVLEKHFKIGGWTHTFRRGKYEWDVGIHYIGEVHKKHSFARRIFDCITDSQLQWSKMDDNYDRIIFPDRSYDFVAPRQRFKEDLIDYFPQEEAAIVTYMDLLYQVALAARPYFTNKVMPRWLGNLTYPFMNRKFYKYSDRTTHDMITELTNNEQLLGVLTGQWGDHGLPPRKSSFAMHAFVARHYLDGANYPTGSSRSIAETVSDLIEAHGGKLVVKAGVEEIVVKNDRAVGVRMEGGEELIAPIVISNAGVVNTFDRLLQEYPGRSSMHGYLDNVVPTASHICLHLGFKKSARNLDFGTTNLWIYPGYDHDQNVAEASKGPDAEFPVVYVSFPSAKDEAWDKDHEGYATMEAITMAHWDWYTDWLGQPWKNRDEDYEALKKKLTDRILDIVFKHVPQAKEHLDHAELSTPLTVNDLANYSLGEMYGIEHSPQRFRQRWLQPYTDVKGLFLTGQDVATVGLSSAVFSGLMTASAILKKNLFKSL